MKPIVQLSLDLTSIEEALAVAEIGVRAGVDWLEAGTPLILAEGLRAVRALHERFPDHPIVADLKTMDGGYLEAEMMAKAGASMVIVMGVAHPATIRAVVRAARDYRIKVMGDVMAAPDKVACAQMLEANGVDYVIVHTGFDERHETPDLSPLDDLPAIAAAVSIPVQVVGGLTLDQIVRLPEMRAPLVVVGAPLAISDEAFVVGMPGDALENVLRKVVALVHGRGEQAT
ncbi:MAG TPA: orotidine 5'-phosphate decarboxylase / HUMPS family protein [Chloroflexia bacterium]|nr:orotidine 5'-phosphate decarboxylase / HUMPS family protein [Chloroflexia bacterium]